MLQGWVLSLAAYHDCTISLKYEGTVRKIEIIGVVRDARVLADKLIARMPVEVESFYYGGCLREGERIAAKFTYRDDDTNIPRYIIKTLVWRQ